MTLLCALLHAPEKPGGSFTKRLANMLRLERDTHASMRRQVRAIFNCLPAIIHGN